MILPVNIFDREVTVDRRRNCKDETEAACARQVSIAGERRGSRERCVQQDTIANTINSVCRLRLCRHFTGIIATWLALLGANTKYITAPTSTAAPALIPIVVQTPPESRSAAAARI